MAFCRLTFPLFVLSVVSSNAAQVPVYMWGDLPTTSIKSSPLTAVSTPKFESILKQELAEDPLTVVFIEKNLSVEDFSRKDDNGETPFSFLHFNLRKAIYIPSVENSLRALNLIALPAQSDRLTLTDGGLSEEITPKNSVDGKFVFITLDDALERESRSEVLERHDKFMEKTIKDLRSQVGDDEKIIAVYTGESPYWVATHSRVRRSITMGNNTFTLDGLQLYVSSIDVVTGNSTFALTGVPETSTVYNDTTNTMNATMKFGNTSITLNLNKKSGYWFFNTVMLELPSLAHDDELYPALEIYALDGFSYRCHSRIAFSGINETKSYTVIFNDMKIQPFFTKNGTQEFGDSFNCVGFFSAPIWSGLFVVFILLSITFYGIMMMMDIKTMDRFDDPKGKTITINAGE